MRHGRNTSSGGRAGWLLIGSLALLLAGSSQRAASAQEVASAQLTALEKTKALQNDPLLAGTERFANGATDVTELNLDRNMMAMAARFIDKDDAEARRLMEKMDFVYVKTYEYGKPGQYRAEDLAPFRSRLDETQWSHVVRTRSANDSTDIWIKADADGAMSELMVISAEPQELTFVHLKGHMTMDELEKAGAKYGVPQTDAAAKKGAK